MQNWAGKGKNTLWECLKAAEGGGAAVPGRGWQDRAGSQPCSGVQRCRCCCLPQGAAPLHPRAFPSCTGMLAVPFPQVGLLCCLDTQWELLHHEWVLGAACHAWMGCRAHLINLLPPQSPLFSLCLFFFVAFSSPPLYCQTPFTPRGLIFL